MTDVSFTLDAGQFTPDELAQALDRLDSLLTTKLRGAANDIAQKVAGDARRKAPVDTGTLASSIEGVVDQVSDIILVVRVGSNQPQAAPQEFGTDPFFPPPSELRDWARRVLGDADLAFPVAQSISETGIEEQPYLRPAWKENITWAVDRITRAVDDALAEAGFA